MAAVENLEIIVDVDIASAVAALEDLQDELRDLSDTIDRVDARGTEGIDIRTSLDDLDAEFAALEAELQAFERTHSLDIDTNIDDDVGGRGARGGASAVQNMNVMADDVRILAANVTGGGAGGGGFDMPGGGGGAGSPDIDFDFGGGGGRAVGRSIAGALPDGDMDAFKRLRRNLGRLSGQFRSLRDSLSRFNLRMSDIHNLLATLVPLILVFIGAIPAVVTALVGLAAAALTAAASLAAIVGFGALGVGLQDGQFDMQRLAEVWSEIQSDFIEAFAPLAERLQPLFMDAIDGLDRFFQAVANQGDALMALTDEARAFGGFLMDFIPSALRTLAALVEALSPILGNIGQAIEDNFNSWVRELVRLTQEAMPAVSALVQTIAEALPTIVEVSIEFAKVANAALEAIGFIWNLVTVFGLLDEQMALVLASGLALLTFVGLLVKILGPFYKLLQIVSLTAMRNFIVAMGAAARSVLMFAGSLLSSALGAIWSFSAAIVASIPVLGSYTIAQYAATAALASFITLATLGAGLALVGMAMSAASGFLGLADSIDTATSSLKDFDRVAGNTGTDGFNPYGGDDPPSGAGAANATGGGGSGGSNVVINMESSGDEQEDASNARYASWRAGRTTGGNN